jgi:hypothetical protein
MNMTVTPTTTTVTRLVAGVELKLQTSGKHWTLSVSKKKKDKDNGR